MVVNLKAKKRLTARVTGVGVHRIQFDTDHLDDVADAITRETFEVSSQQTQSRLNHLPELQEEEHKQKSFRKTREEQNKVPNKEEKVQE